MAGQDKKTPNKNQETDAKLEILEAEVVALKKENQQLRTEINTLNSLPRIGKKVVPINLPSTKVGGKNYKFTAPAFFYNGVKILAQDAAKDKDLCAELIEKGISVLEKT